MFSMIFYARLSRSIHKVFSVIHMFILNLQIAIHHTEDGNSA